MNHLRLYFEVMDPTSGDLLTGFVDLERTYNGAIITDWGVLYDQVESSVGEGSFMSGGRKVQPAWFYGIAEEKAKNAEFPEDNGVFYVSDYKPVVKNIHVDYQ